MKIIPIIILGVLFLLSLNLVSAVQPTQQSNKLFLNPFYRASMTSGTNYTYNISIDVPDKISLVSSAIISFDVYITPTVTFTLWVNNQPCNNPTYVISTTFSGSGQSRITFDCSNVITKAGFYNIILKPTQANTGTISGWIDLTYSNNPQGSLEVHGTEYTIGQTAKVWLQLLNSSGIPISNGVCYTDIYNPDGTEFVERANMINMNHDGVYYYDFEVPAIEGVYPNIAVCYYTATQNFLFANNYFINYGSYDSGTLANTYLIDTNFIRFKETAVNPTRNISIGFNFNMSSCKTIDELLLTGLSIRTVGKFDSVVSDDITISIYNYTSASWQNLFNKMLEGNVWRDVSNSFSLNNLTKAGLINSTGNLAIKFTDVGNLTDGATSNLDIDYASVSCDQLSVPTWEALRGSSEIHISSPINVTLVGEEVAQAVWNYNGTINNNILTQFGNTIWNWSGSIATNILNLFSGNIWTHSNRNLTYTPDQNITTQIINVTTQNVSVINQTVNVTTQQVNVVNQTINVTTEQVNVINQTINVTTQNVSVINQTVNVTTEQVNVNEGAIADAVWSHTPNRNLTYYETSNVNVTINGTDVAEQVWNYDGVISDNILDQFSNKLQCIFNQLFSTEDGKWGVDLSAC